MDGCLPFPHTTCADDEGSPLWGEDSSRRAGHERRLATIGLRQLPYLPHGAAAAPSTSSPLGKRARQEYETPDLPGHANRQQWLAGQLAAFEAVAAAASSGDAGSGAAMAGTPEGSSEASGGPWTAALAAKHAAIFSLVYGLLDEGEDRRCALRVVRLRVSEPPRPPVSCQATLRMCASECLGGLLILLHTHARCPCRSFNEVYLPWLNDHELPAQRLDLEFATLLSYLRLAGGSGMGWGTVRGLMAAYIKAVMAKAGQR